VTPQQKIFSKMARLFKRIHFSIVTPAGHVRRDVQAPVRKRFHADGIEHQLAVATVELAHQFPGVFFRMVRLGPASFSFIHPACDVSANGR
jgi:hypothetical protein